MATTAVLVDTSVAVPLVVSDHTNHLEVRTALATRRLGLAGHAAFETYSVLTRLPGPARRSPEAVSRLLHVGFPDSRFLPDGQAERLFGELARVGIAGGSVFDALVGAVAVHHRRVLVTRDTRAVRVYRALGVEYELIGGESVEGLDGS